MTSSRVSAGVLLIIQCFMQGSRQCRRSNINHVLHTICMASSASCSWPWRLEAYTCASDSRGSARRRSPSGAPDRTSTSLPQLLGQSDSFRTRQKTTRTTITSTCCQLWGKIVVTSALRFLLDRWKYIRSMTLNVASLKQNSSLALQDDEGFRRFPLSIDLFSPRKPAGWEGHQCQSSCE